MDLIDRQAAIDAIANVTNCGDEKTLRAYVTKHNLDNGWTGGVLEAIDAIEDLPPAQPERAIPLSWIEGYIERLRNTNGIHSALSVSIIDMMIDEWEKTQKGVKREND